MINIFLKAKHWQLFLLIFIAPLIFQFIIMGFLAADLMTLSGIDFTVIINYMRLNMLISMAFMSVFWAWLGSIAIGLQKKIPNHIKMKINKFKIFFLTTFIYFISFIILISVMLSNGFFTTSGGQYFANIGILMVLIFPLHLFSMFCLLYSLYFTAKAIKTVELQREVEIKDFIEELILILFYPIGLWIIQPRINKIINDTLIPDSNPIEALNKK